MATALSEADREVLANIDRYGWSFMFVSPVIGDPEPHVFWGLLGHAQWYYEAAEGFPVRQLVLPDDEGHYPWEDGYRIRPGAQPLLISDSEAEALGIS